MKSRKKSQETDPLLPSRDATLISSLSEPELDLLISLKQLAITRSKLAGHRDLASKFDPRILRALGVILLEHLKENLKCSPNHAIIADLIDKLPLLSISTPENIKLENSITSFATMSRNYMHDGEAKDDGEG